MLSVCCHANSTAREILVASGLRDELVCQALGLAASNMPEHRIAFLIQPAAGRAHPPEDALGTPLAAGAVVSVIAYTAYGANAQAR